MEQTAAAAGGIARGRAGTRVLRWDEIQRAADACARRLRVAVTTERRTIAGIWGVPRGGVPPAVLVAEALCLPLLDDGPVIGDDVTSIVLDDLVDSGRTLAPWAAQPLLCDALFRKPHAPPHLAPEAEVVVSWVRFPWEAPDDDGAGDAVVRLLQAIGEDPDRPGLRETPARVVRALREMTSGSGIDPAAIVGDALFDREACDEMVVCRDITFASLCEHHLLPFMGVAHVAYIPGKKGIVGLSKLARLVELFARRLQVQERLTVQIAEALAAILEPQGVGVVIEAQHACMACRGVVKPTARFVTSCLRGLVKEDGRARAEFMRLGLGA